MIKKTFLILFLRNFFNRFVIDNEKKSTKQICKIEVLFGYGDPINPNNWKSKAKRKRILKSLLNWSNF